MNDLLILHNAKVITMDPDLPSGTAIAVKGGKILAVGKDDDVLNLSSPLTHSINMGNKTIIPGLVDSHIHLKHYALSLQKIDCETNTKEECLSRIHPRVQELAPGEWVLGHGWNQNEWETGFGSKQDLDKLSPQNPVYLTAKSLHAGWVNSSALKAASINKHSNDPPGGKIQRMEDGEPTGILFENAMNLLNQAIPEPSQEHITTSILKAQEVLLSLGLTGVHDFDRQACFISLQDIHQSQDLTLRVVKNLPVEQLDYIIAIGLRSGFGDDFLRIGGIKAFADGALGPHTAAILQPYENDPDNLGILLLDREEIFEFGKKAVENGLSLTIHAIGDRANHEVLSAYKQLREYETRNNIPHRRHRVEHVQLIHPDDLVSLSRNEIIASMQPIHAISDMKMADANWGSRAGNSYAWKSIRNASGVADSVVLSFGSDAPVDSPNPFWGLHAAVTRQYREQPSMKPWYPEQRLSLLDSLKAYTIGPAFAAGMENRSGKLKTGYFADMLVIKENLFEIQDQELHTIKPVKTMVNGKWMFERE